MQAIHRQLLVATVVTLVLACCAANGAEATDITDTYSDPIGDVQPDWANVVPDVAQVTLVSSDDGSVRLDVHLAKQNDLRGGAPGSGLSWIFVQIDADKNPATGGPYGDFVAYQIGPQRFAFRRWNGSSYSDFTHQPAAEHFDGTDLTFTLNPHDMGITTFDFSVTGGNLGVADTAPDTGEYSYPPAIATLEVPARLLRPMAGRVYRIQGVTVHLDNGTTAAPNQLTCVLTYRTRTLHPVARGCAWKVPRSYRRKVLQLTLTASYRGSSLTSRFVVRPR